VWGGACLFLVGVLISINSIMPSPRTPPPPRGAAPLDRSTQQRPPNSLEGVLRRPGLRSSAVRDSRSARCAGPRAALSIRSEESRSDPSWIRQRGSARGSTLRAEGARRTSLSRYLSGSCSPHQLAIWVPWDPPLTRPSAESVTRAQCEASSRLFGDDPRGQRATLMAKVIERRPSPRTTLDVFQR
jgi:hypothetical protein